ncbi:hypothetical protein YC2023_108813 [Brassica napus]
MKKRIERRIRWEHTHDLRSSRPLTRVTTSPRDYSSESTRSGDTFKPNAQEDKMERLILVVPKDQAERSSIDRAGQEIELPGRVRLVIECQT